MLDEKGVPFQNQNQNEKKHANEQKDDENCMAGIRVGVILIQPFLTQMFDSTQNRRSND